jgi:H+/gluconate symporter-like permease
MIISNKEKFQKWLINSLLIGVPLSILLNLIGVGFWLLVLVVNQGVTTPECSPVDQYLMQVKQEFFSNFVVKYLLSITLVGIFTIEKLDFLTIPKMGDRTEKVIKKIVNVVEVIAITFLIIIVLVLITSKLC